MVGEGQAARDWEVEMCSISVCNLVGEKRPIWERDNLIVGMYVSAR